MSRPPSARPLLWLASFPKSGSTWLRFLLHHLFYGPPARSALLDIGLPSLHGDKESPEAAVARGGVVLTHKSADAHHARWPEGAGFVHLVRHPVDVVMSDTRFFVMTQLDGYLRSQGRRSDQVRKGDVQVLANLFLTSVLQDRATPQRRELGVGTWGQHTHSWLQRPGPGLRVRYEDLRSQPKVELRRVLDALRLPIPDARLDQAVAACDVAAMRAMQEREISAKVPGRFYDPAHAAGYKAGLRFVGPARVGDLVSLPAPVRVKLRDRLGEQLAALGYAMSAEDAVLERPIGLDELAPLRDFPGLGVAAPPR